MKREIFALLIRGSLVRAQEGEQKTKSNLFFRLDFLFLAIRCEVIPTLQALRVLSTKKATCQVI